MTTDTHAALLAELPGEFIPKYESLGLTSHIEDGELWFYWHHNRNFHQEAGRYDAHSHIELAAWKRVRAWCQSQGLMMHVDDDDDQPSIYCGPASEPRMLGTGPDDATALLAACRWINEQEKR